MALLRIAADWSRRRGRRLLAVTVDHGLNAASPDWSRFCRQACAALGVDWIERRWEGDKPTTGLTAAARTARHGLIADAAREAGAKVILMAHTADDIAESDWMRERGSTLGQLREWSPSPAWPQGRGLMLLRPMLGERREALRDGLRVMGQGWIEDPANADDRFERSRARVALNPLPLGEGLSAREPSGDRSLRERVRGRSPTGEGMTPHPFGLAHRSALRASSPLPMGEGIVLERSAPNVVLSAALVSVGGTDRPPRGERLHRLTNRLASNEDFTSTLAGARIVVEGDAVLIGREPGDLRRRLVPDVRLHPDKAVVWDGRYELTVSEPGWTVTAALGRLASLSDADRAGLRAVPAWARAALPVLIREGGTAPVLAWRAAEVRALAPRRLELALSGGGSGETTHEANLFDAIHGETPPSDLFSEPDHEPASASRRRRGTENRNEPA